MKKLLTILGSLMISTSGASLVVACGNINEPKAEKKTKHDDSTKMDKTTESSENKNEVDPKNDPTKHTKPVGPINEPTRKAKLVSINDTINNRSFISGTPSEITGTIHNSHFVSKVESDPVSINDTINNRSFISGTPSEITGTIHNSHFVSKVESDPVSINDTINNRSFISGTPSEATMPYGYLGLEDLIK
uniref:lipoprotein n=1 Tax=Mycoplasma feriruminatoris TaxID=1179777 RepID=UPI0002A4F39B|nr:lipoprotein [Mycoplasma feriruminatoris]